MIVLIVHILPGVSCWPLANDSRVICTQLVGVVLCAVSTSEVVPAGLMLPSALNCHICSVFPGIQVSMTIPSLRRSTDLGAAIVGASANRGVNVGRNRA